MKAQNLAEAGNQLALIESLKQSEHYRAFLNPLLTRLANEALARVLDENIEPKERDRRFQRYLAYRDVAGIIDKQEAALRGAILRN
jgi:hypothetical protein